MPFLLALPRDNSAIDWVPKIARDLGVEFLSFDSPAALLDGPPLSGPCCLVSPSSAFGPRGDRIAQIHRLWPALALVFVGRELTGELVIALARAGATDVLADPVDEARAIEAVREGLRRSAAIEELTHQREDVLKKLGKLTRRENQVLQMISEGASSKAVASCLGISKRTVDYHRRQIMLKTATHSATELVDLAHQGRLLAYRRQAQMLGLPSLEASEWASG